MHKLLGIILTALPMQKKNAVLYRRNWPERHYFFTVHKMDIKVSLPVINTLTVGRHITQLDLKQ